ncbi:MAG: malonyl-ACP O-methyltransferase BioC [Xanthomonadales bacterium]|nr:malonyl-ACP O-methyltransferase BioC [Xanthomonadales bacterium]
MQAPDDTKISQSRPATEPADLDIDQARLSFHRAASDYEEHAWLQQEVGGRLLERLDELNTQPQTVVDMGCGTGLHSIALKNRYPKAEVIGIDFAEGMLTQAKKRNSWRRKVDYRQADMGNCGLADASVDLLYSNFSLQWAVDLRAMFNEWRRIMKPSGLLLFTTLGPGTLLELRQAWEKVDNKAHVNDFIDIRDVGDALVAAGFYEPVMDAEMLTLTYSSVHKLMRELKGMGAHNVNHQRQHGLTGAGRMRAMCAAYKDFRLPDGRYPASWEVIYGVAWQPEDGQPVRTITGEEASFSVEHLLNSRLNSRKNKS